MPLAQDAFTRTVDPGGWGTASVGGAYTTVDPATRLSVDPGAGKMTVSAGSNASALLRTISATSVVYRASFSSSASYTTVSGNQSFSLIARGITITGSAQTAYLARVRIEASNILRLLIIRKDGTTETSIGDSHTITLPSGYIPGQKIWCEVYAIGINPTTLGAKMWLDGQPEPHAHQVKGTDATAAFQVAGTIGLQTYLAGIATAGIVASYHSLSVEEPGAPNLMVTKNNSTQESNIRWTVKRNNAEVGVKRWYVIKNGVPVLLKRKGVVAEPDDSLYLPISYSDLATARAELGAPTDATYVIWNHGNQDLQTVLSSLADNTILVLPERPEPYWIDTSNGFMASGVKEVDGIDPVTGLKDGRRYPVVSRSNLWFGMARIKRGIMGMGPGAVISPRASSWTQGPWPIHAKQPEGQKFSYVYMTNGTRSNITGAMSHLIETGEQNRPFFANFRITGRDFGGVQYTGISSGHASVTARTTTVRRIHFDGCWRGDAAVPTGETGGLGMLRGDYLIENCMFTPDGGASPIMWNRNRGGVMRNVKIGKPREGMITFWESSGVNVFENVRVTGKTVGINIEDNGPNADFSLNWTGGSISLDSAATGNKFHVNISPKYRSVKVHLQDVAVSSNGYTKDRTSAHVYAYANTQKRSDVTVGGSTLPISRVPDTRWID